eukprot:scaffold151000_cov27-Prasinocladus_malaysianus.AAC.1
MLQSFKCICYYDNSLHIDDCLRSPIYSGLSYVLTWTLVSGREQGRAEAHQAGGAHPPARPQARWRGAARHQQDLAHHRTQAGIPHKALDPLLIPMLKHPRCCFA